MIEIVNKNNQDDKDFENLTEYLLKKNIAFSILQETPKQEKCFQKSNA